MSAEHAARVRVIGIDEAGYGPTLGPLVVGACCWEMPRAAGPADHWDMLHDAVRRATGKGDAARLIVDDSKRAFKRKQGLHTLERSVLAFARAAGQACGTRAELLRALVAPDPPPGNLPWYLRPDRPLPLDPVRSSFEGVSARLERALQHASLRCDGLCALVISEDEYNRRLSNTTSKALLLLEQIQRMLVRCVDRAVLPTVCYIDRLGGRTDYRAYLSEAFPRHALAEVEVSPTRSAYRLRHAHAPPIAVEFRVDSDQHHLPVALASMTAKYVRELLMLEFNAYWRELAPRVRPTAGYYTDAQRFLRDIEPVLPRAGLKRLEFVRQR